MNVISSAAAVFQKNKGWADRAIAQVPDDKMHLPLDANSNSFAVIMKHLAGNLLSRWTDFLTTDGEKPWRDRESEFEARSASPSEIQAKWERGWDVLIVTLSELQDTDLSRTVTIRGVELRVDEALLRSLAHTSYHVGQIVFAAKRFLGESWTYLSIPPGDSAAYAANPVLEKASQHAKAMPDDSR